MKLKFLIVLPIFISICSCLYPNFSFKVLNDIHANPLYDPNLLENYCTRSFSSAAQSSQDPIIQNFSTFGRLGCDPPYKLLKILLHKMKSSSEFSPDFLILPGDFVSHGFSQDSRGNFSAITYELLKEIIKRTYREIKFQFGGSFLFPAIGNNDAEFHYEVPMGEDRRKYYSVLFEEWFEKNPKNNLLRNFAEIKTDFLNGGYYKADLADNFSIIVLNTLYWNSANNANNDPETGEIQLIWLEKKLAETRLRAGKAIMVSHIFSGLNYYTEIQYFLNQTANEKIQKLMYEYRDVIIFNVASHLHTNGFRVSHLQRNGSDFEEESDELFGNTIISGSASPGFSNNPSFLSIGFENFQPKTAVYTYFNLKELVNNPKHEEFTIDDIRSFFFDYDLNKEYDLVDIGTHSLSKLAKRLYEDEALLRKFLVWTYGYPYTEENAYFVYEIYLKWGLFKDSVNWEFNELEKRKYLCTLVEMNEEGFQKCVGN